MLQPNLVVCALAALFPLVLGFIWYNPKVFGNAWLAGAGLTAESAQKDFNMPVVLGLNYIFSFLIAVSLNFMVIHQYGLQSLIMPEKGKAVADPNGLGAQVMELYKHSFHSFHHGVIHGTIVGILFVLPLLAGGALFERRGWKYILINGGYWTICLAVMGGIVCRFS